MSETAERRIYLPTDRVRQGLARRYAAERRFHLACLAAISSALLFLTFLFVSIFANGYGAFFQTYLTLDVELDEAVVDPAGERKRRALASADYTGLIRDALIERFPGVTARNDRRELFGLVSKGAGFDLRDRVLRQPDLVGRTVTLRLQLSDDADMLAKGKISRRVPESDRRVSDQQIGWLDELASDGRIERRFNLSFFSRGDSREPELAGIWGAVVGSFYTMLVTLRVLSSTSRSCCWPSWRLPRASKVAPAAPTAAASVGVNTPEYMPPTMITGVIRGKNALQNPTISSLRVANLPDG